MAKQISLKVNGDLAAMVTVSDAPGVLPNIEMYQDMTPHDLIQLAFLAVVSLASEFDEDVLVLDLVTPNPTPKAEPKN